MYDFLIFFKTKIFHKRSIFYEFDLEKTIESKRDGDREKDSYIHVGKGGGGGEKKVKIGIRREMCPRGEGKVDGG